MMMPAPAPGMPQYAGMPVGVGAPVMVVPAGGPGSGANQLDALARLPGLYIKQRISILQALTGFDVANQYAGFAWVSRLTRVGACEATSTQHPAPTRNLGAA
jgi:hypothetical protein